MAGRNGFTAEVDTSKIDPKDKDQAVEGEKPNTNWQDLVARNRAAAPKHKGKH